MLDLGTSFLASVARDPDALALVDGEVRLSYAEWLTKISSLVSVFDRQGLKPGDHLVTVLQNNWQAATVHWACQLAGIIITPINWRVKGDELDFCIENSECRALVYQDVSGGSRLRIEARRQPDRDASGRHIGTTQRPIARCNVRRSHRRDRPACNGRFVVDHALHVGHDVTAQRRAAAPPRRTRGRGRPCRAEPLSLRRTDIRSDAALSHHGRTFADRDVIDRRHLRLFAALRSATGAVADRCGADHQSLSGADAVPRPRAWQRFRASRRFERSQAWICRRVDDRRLAQKAQ